MPPPILSSRKRLWWCPIGELGLLPIHAAGVWRECPAEHVGNYVVSSYVPTLTALYRMFTVRSNEGSSSIRSPRILLLAQPHCNGLPSLPNTQIEIDRVRKLVSADSLIAMPQVSVDGVLAAVGDAHVLHLACHGKQDTDNPLHSGFELTDGRLTLAKLRRARIPHAQLAYLSACESAGMDDSRPDEGLNLAGAMVFVGFKSVIATLW
jgi:CHAT domain-containing protein